jgi:cyclophilin family peptidyl-prolyl cis-trans isomerase/HEAT repeat protein
MPRHVSALQRLFAGILLLPVLAAAGCGGPSGSAGGGAGSTGLTEALLAEIYQYEDRRTAVEDRFNEFAVHPDPAVRSRAALALGRIGGPRAAALLERFVQDEDSAVRGEASFAAGLNGDPALGPALRLRLEDPDPQVRGLAIQALLRLGPGEEGPAALSRLLLERAAHAGSGKQGTEELQAILGNAWRLDGDDGLAGLLLEWAAKPAGSGGRMRQLAIYSLSRRGDPGAVPLFIRLLADPDPALRALSAKGLGTAGARGADPAVAGAALADLLASEEEWLVRVEGLTALGRLGVAPEPGILCRAMADEHPQVQIAAIRAGGGMSGVGDEVLLWLATLLGAEEPGVAPAAAAALARLGDPRGRRWGLDASGSTEPFRRADAAAVLAHAASDDGARAALRTLLGDESGSVVRAALTAVAGAGRSDEFLEDIARTLMEGTDALTRAAAAEALGAAGDPLSSLPLLLAADQREARQKAPDCRLSILGLLANHPENADAVRAVKRGLEGRDRLIRQRAAEILAGWGRRTEIPPGVCEARGQPPLETYRRAAELYRSRVEACIDTSHGTVRVELFPREAPLTVLHFIDLARKGCYFDSRFHRVVPGFVLQGGDPQGDGWGGPGDVIRCEINRREFDRGMVGMALSGKDTGGSQFFVTLAPQPHLDGRYTIFGRVVEGMTIVDRMRLGERMTRVRLAVDPA